jgi:uncharacterized protein YbjT (DUF2867 family)
MSKKIIVVFGATGLQGGSVVRYLAAENQYNIRAITRDAKSPEAQDLETKFGVTLVEANINEPETYDRMFEGAYGAFVVTNFWDEDSMYKEKEQGMALADVAKKHGLQHYVWSTAPNVAMLSNGKYNCPHFSDKAFVDEHILGLQFPFITFVQPPFYFQNFENYFPIEKSEEQWVVNIPRTRTITAFDVTQIGGVVAAVFRHPEIWNRTVIPISADHLTMPEIELILSRAMGQQVVINQIPPDTFAKYDRPGAKELAEMFKWMDEYTFYGPLAKRELGLRAYPVLRTFLQYYSDPNVLAKLPH